jgi:phosphoglucomutase
VQADLPDVDLSKIGTTKFGDFEVEVIDYAADYLAVLQEARRR